MIDELSLQLSAYAPFQARSGTKAAGWRRSPLSRSPGATILMLVAFEGLTLSPCYRGKATAGLLT